MRNVPKGEDEGWLFLSETGTQIDSCGFLKSVKKCTRFAGISGNIRSTRNSSHFWK